MSTLRTTLATVAAGLAVAVPTSGQLAITHSYPFGLGRTVVVDTTDPLHPIVYEGSGAGIWVLNGSSPSPALESPPIANQLRAGGLVRDLALTSQHLYAAAHRAGLVRFELGGTSQIPEWKLDEVADAWAITVVERPGEDDLVFVGTNPDFDEGTDGDGISTGKSGGDLYIVHAPVSGSASVFGPLPVGAPVYSLASFGEGDDIVLLVGTACREDANGPASLIRYDFHIENDQLPESFPAETAHWSADDGTGPQPTFIRDIEMDPTRLVAYVATYTRGVHKIDLTSAGLAEIVDEFWPIVAPAGQTIHFDSLAVLDDIGAGGLGRLLAVGGGPFFPDEKTYWGDVSKPVACDDSTEMFTAGIWLYDITDVYAPLGEPRAYLQGCMEGQGAETCVGAPLALAIYKLAASDEVLIDAASNGHGLQVVQGAPGTSGQIELSTVGDWNKADGKPDSSADDVLILDNTAFVAFEHGIWAGDATYVNGQPAPLFLSEPVSFDAHGGVILSGAVATSGYPTMVFASAQAEGTVFYEVTGDGPISIAYQGHLNPVRETASPRTQASVTLPATQTPDGYPWLIVVNNLDPFSSEVCGNEPDRSINGSVVIYRIKLTPDGHIGAHVAQALGAYRPSPCTNQLGFLMGAYATAAQGNDVTIWLPYSPRTGGGGDSEPDAGLLALQATYNSHGSGSVSITPVGVGNGKVVAFSSPSTPDLAGFIDYDAATGTLVATYATLGVAAFHVSSLSSVPTVQAVFQETVAAPAKRTSFLDVKLGAGGYAYAAGLDGRIWVFDPTDMSVVGKFETHGQVGALWPTTSTVPGAPAFLIADFGAGVVRGQFQSVPSPP